MHKNNINVKIQKKVRPKQRGVKKEFKKRLSPSTLITFKSTFHSLQHETQHSPRILFSSVLMLGLKVCQNADSEQQQNIPTDNALGLGGYSPNKPRLHIDIPALWPPFSAVKLLQSHVMMLACMPISGVAIRLPGGCSPLPLARVLEGALNYLGGEKWLFNR